MIIVVVVVISAKEIKEIVGGKKKSHPKISEDIEGKSGKKEFYGYWIT